MHGIKGKKGKKGRKRKKEKKKKKNSGGPVIFQMGYSSDMGLALGSSLMHVVSRKLVHLPAVPP